jgi:hypothetical protein
MRAAAYWVIASVWGAGLLAGCSAEAGADDACVRGTEACECADGLCNDGLQCRSDRCVAIGVAPVEGCVDDTDCEKGGVCDRASRACEPGQESTGEPARQNVAADAACNVETQAGCGEGRICLDVDGKGRTSCYSTGSGAQGAECATLNDCSSGLLCVGAQCRDRCTTPADCEAAPFASCSPLWTGPNKPTIDALSTCAVHCNPADPGNVAQARTFDACTPGATCLPHDDGARGSTDCYLAGETPEGGACSVIADCAAGSVCVSEIAGGSGYCRALCLMGDSACGAGACQPFGEAFFVGVGASLVEVGYCE